MTKILYVGDPHVQVSNLKDSQALMDYIIQLAGEQDVDQITFLGDMFHTHAVVRVEVIDFWRKSILNLMSLGKRIVCLVGNHDQPGSKEKEQEMNALIAFEDLDVFVVNKPYVDTDTNISYIPYMSDHEAFIGYTNKCLLEGGTGCLIAHQTFTGAQYENGFFSEEGIDPALVSQQEIISGHIHKSQQVGKCFYPGTPKWDTMSDANQPKGLYIITHAEDGTTREKQFFPTDHVVTPIKSYEVKEGDELPELNPEARNHVVLEGKSAWISKMKKKIGKIANIKVKPTDRITKVNKDNSATLEKYLDTEFQPIDGVTKKDLKEFVSNL
jgi:DNA repair exonuclease SbcCD nuclease subunit